MDDENRTLDQRNFRQASRRFEMMVENTHPQPMHRQQPEERGEVAAVFRLRNDEHGVLQVFTDPPDQYEF